jgi:hypothetical protein
MARTNVKGTQVLDGSIGRVDLNTTIPGSAVITKIIGSNGLAIAASTGADSGTGDVTLATDLTYLNTKYPSLDVVRTQNHVFAGPSSGSGTPAFRALVAGDIPAISIAGVTGLQTALDTKLTGSGTTGYLSKYTGSLVLGNSVLFESGGNIGIGTTNVVSRLTFASFRSNTEETVGLNFHQALSSGGLPAYGIGMGPAALEGYLTYRAGEGNSSVFGHKFFVNNVEVMRVRGDGNVGIGTIAPAFKLDVAGDVRVNAGGNLRLYRSNSSTQGLSLTAGNSNNLINAVTGGLILSSAANISFDATSGHTFRDGTGVNTFMSITTGGEIGIGAGTPRTRAHIFGTTGGINGMDPGSAAGTSLIISNNNPAYGLHVGVYSNGMTWLQAARTDGTTTVYNIALQSAGGNVGIGTTTPGYKLDVSGTGNFSGNVTVAGNVGIGSVPVSYNSLRINKPITGAITSVALMNGGVVQADVTSQAIYSYNQLNTYAAPFTLNNAILFSAGQGVIGEGSSVSSVFGYHVESTLTAGANNYAFFSGLSAGTGRWNIYMLGTANNYLAGNLWIGTTSGLYKLDVNGTGHFSGNVTFDANVIIATVPVNTNHAVNKAYADLKMLAPTIAPSSGQFIKYDGSNNSWANIGINDISGLQSVLDAKLSGAGTASYISKYSTTGILTVSQLFDNGTNIGIGTNVPAFKLDITGDTRINGGNNLRFYRSDGITNGLNLSSGTSSNYISAISGGLVLTSLAGMTFDSGSSHVFRDSSGTNTFMSINNIGNVGIGTASASAKLELLASSTLSSMMIRSFSGNISENAGIHFQQSRGIIGWDGTYGALRLGVSDSGKSIVFVTGNSAGTGEIARLTGSGNFGLGISTPSYKLDVNGTAHFSSNVTFDANVIISTSPGSGNHAVNKTYVDLRLLAPSVNPLMGQFLKYNGSNIWATPSITDISGLQSALDAKISGNGTAGYLGKYSGTLSLGNSILYESNGNLGIGTTNTISRLTFGSFRTLDTETVGINFHQALTSGALPAYGIGMGPAATEGYLTFRAGEANSSIFGHKFFVNNLEVMRVRGDGRVGIGTSLPAYFLDVAGTGRFTGNVTFDANAICTSVPSNASHLTNKAYVDALAFIKRGDSVKTISLTNITLSGIQIINAVSLVAGDLILVAGQNTGTQNGVYVVAGGVWNRATSNDSDLEIRGAYHYITDGTYANQRYINTNAGPITVGVTVITYALDFGAETDPVWSAFQSANGIDSIAINNWNTAYNNRISTKSTGDLVEGSNLYFTPTRVLDTLLTGYSTGSNTGLTSTDKVIDAFRKIQGQINNRVAIGGNTIGSSITVGTNDNFDFSLRRNNAVQAILKSGVLEVNSDLDIKGKLKLNGQTGSNHQFVKYNGTATEWASLDTSELADKNDIVMLATISGERGFQLFADTSKTYAESFLYTNPDAGISLGLHGYALDSSDNIKEFGMQLDTDGYLYHKKIDGARSKIATVDMINGGSGYWNGGSISDSIYMPINKNIYWDKNSNSYAFIGFSIQAMVVPQQKLFSIQSYDTMGIGATNDLFISGNRIMLQKGSNPIEFDLSNAISLIGQNVKLIVDAGTGITRVKLIAA